MGTLFVVATPIGNVDDLSPRARRVLGNVDVIAAEDTRHTGRLLARLAISTPLVSYHVFNEKSRIQLLLERLANGDVALVSDAGTPAISDPGAAIVRAAILAGHPVVAIPGPSALSAAMSISGFSDGPVVFLGFLPRKQGERARLLQQSLETGFAVYLFESPRRVMSTIRELAALVPDREVAVFRELSKLHEEVLRGSATDLLHRLNAGPNVRGEIVIGVAGRAGKKAPAESERSLLSTRLNEGMSVARAAKEVADITGIPRSELYQLALSIRGEVKVAHD
jgi:16S rRNA (cytidine1402-2'-O)-methyltransferase